MYEKGMSVKIVSVESTRKHIGLDSHHEMENMVGKIFPIFRVTSERAYIKGPDSGYGFTFRLEDIRFPEAKEPTPMMFEFDTKHLDI